MSQSHGRIGSVYRLPTWSGGTEIINTDILGIDLHIKILGFGKHHDCGCTRMHPTLGLRLRHSLNTVYTGFEFQSAVNILTRYLELNLFIAAARTFAQLDNIGLPPFGFAIFGVHAKEVARKNTGLVAARSRSDLNDHVLGCLLYTS